MFDWENVIDIQTVGDTCECGSNLNEVSYKDGSFELVCFRCEEYLN